MYSSGSIEEPIYSEPLPIVVTDIVPRILSSASDDQQHQPRDDDDDSGHNQKKKNQQQLLKKSGHSSNFPSDKLTITDESHRGDVEEGRAYGIVVEEVEDDDEDEEEEEDAYEPPLVRRANDSVLIKRLSPPHLKSRPPTAQTFSFNGQRTVPAPPPPPPPPPPPMPLSLGIGGLDKIQVQGKYPPQSQSPASAAAAAATIENGLRRASASSGSRKLPTIMEGIDGQIPRPIWPCDMDDSLMDINFESFLYSNEKRESGSATGGQQQQQQQPPPLHRRRCDSPVYNNEGIGGARSANDIENNYRCMKYLNSCPENPYLVEGVEDLQMSVDKSLALYLKKCDDSLTMQNTREFLEDIRSKLNVLLENHARHSQAQLMRSGGASSADSANHPSKSSEQSVYEKSVALIERQIEKLKLDLDSYLRLFNQPNELQIKQLCTGLAKDVRIQTVQNAIENRNNNNGNSLRSRAANSMTKSVHDPTISLNRLPFGGSVMDDELPLEDADNELNNYETMRDHRWSSVSGQQHQQPRAQNVKIISQYPENDLSSYFDTVYVQDGFNMGYKVNNHHQRIGSPGVDTSSFEFEGPVILRAKHDQQQINTRQLRPGSAVSLLSSSQGGAGKRQSRSTSSNNNSVASSADPNFRLKRNPSLSLSIPSHNYSDRHPILESRDYERSSQEVISTGEEDSLNESHRYTNSTDSLNSHRQQQAKEGHLHKNMMLQQNEFNASSAEETRRSVASVDRQDLIHEWHKNRPSIWELYYGINRPKQTMLGRKATVTATNALLAKSGKKKKKAVIPYVSISPQIDHLCILYPSLSRLVV